MEQRVRNVQSLLRPDLPVPADVEAVDEGDAFAPALKVQVEIQDRLRNEFGVETIMISAATGENIDKLREMLTTSINDAYAVRYPYRPKEW